MPKVIIDDVEYQVKDKKNMLDVCLSLGLNLPYFCWHPAMNSVGACRQCAVTKYKDENDKTGRIVMACMEPVQDGIRISLKDDQSKEFREHIIELLMTNHPHDCPVCDEGGECHLQDMTVMTGHTYRNYHYTKRTFNNQYLGPFINHEMNRCIECYRCVRFYRDYAGGRDFNVFSSRNHVYFGRSEEGILENDFSGNLIEVCPTGVFTDKTLKKHYTRKWDLTNAPSICHNCGVGCNIIIAQRYGSLRRVLSRYNGKVNGYFICDRGRFGYEWVNSGKRILKPLTKNNYEQEITDKDITLQKIAALLSSTKTIGIGSPIASIESNFALRKLVGSENFYAGIRKNENNLYQKTVEILTKGKIKTPSLKEVEEFDAVFILGEDISETAPMLSLALRQAVKLKPKVTAVGLNIPLWQDAAVREIVQNEHGPLYIASLTGTKLDDISKKTFNAPPEDIARLGFAVANILSDKSPAVNDLTQEQKKLAEQIADDLRKADKPLIVTGTGCFSEEILNAAYNVAKALNEKNDNAGITIAVPEVNTIGLTLMNAKNLDIVFKEIESGDVGTLIVLENNLYRKVEKTKLDKLLDKVKNIIVLSSIENETTLKADFVLPVGSFAESEGTVVNNEGRAQRFYRSLYPDENILESWRYIASIGKNAGKTEFNSLNNFDDFIYALIKEFPLFNGMQNAAPPSDFRKADQKIPRSPHRFSGRTAMNANTNVSEPKPPEDHDSPFSFTMEGFNGEPPSTVIPFYWSPGWNSVQSINKYQIEVGGSLHDGDPGIRLIELNKNESTVLNYFNEMPAKFNIKNNEWLLVPVYHIYGSEEYSSLSSAVQERIPEPYLGMNVHDKKYLGLKDNERIKMEISGSMMEFNIKILKSLPKGTIGYPVGLPGMPFTNLLTFNKVFNEKE